MNTVIERHFDTIEVRLITSPVVLSYITMRREIGPTDGKIRLKAQLADGGLLELFAYITEKHGRIEQRKYSFHWQDADGSLKQRWDNAPHFPELPHFPHHTHCQDGTVEGVALMPDILLIMTKIEAALSKSH